MDYVLKAILKKGDSMDVVLTVANDSRSIRAHRAILMAGCAYFETLLTSDFPEKDSDTISLGDSMEFDVLDVLVKFLYTGDLEKYPSAVKLKDLLRAADYLQMESALEPLRQQIQNEITTVNALGLWDIRNVINDDKVLAIVRGFILDNFMAIIEDFSFLQVNFDTISWIIEADDLHVDSERDVFRAIKMWINHDYAERVKYLVSLLGCVRYDANVTLQFIMQDMLGYCKCTESLDFIIAYLAKRANYSGKLDLVVKARTQEYNEDDYGDDDDVDDE